ncbi:unnamed protein product [Thelazia callipaeda]|uniref:Ovule protein n=1 Tax=Thelazia callipaeda TaxID=103827 RepID=A0A0N5CMN4_THECL|nr:unnamed protein product [Thelazia callipaeda]
MLNSWFLLNMATRCEKFKSGNLRKHEFSACCVQISTFNIPVEKIRSTILEKKKKKSLDEEKFLKTRTTRTMKTRTTRTVNQEARTAEQEKSESRFRFSLKVTV